MGGATSSGVRAAFRADLAREPADTEPNDQPVIQLDHVSLAFDEPVLEDVSFEARKGETLCIVGESGTRKSTALKLILRLLVPEKGSVCICGKRMTGLPFDEAVE